MEIESDPAAIQVTIQHVALEVPDSELEQAVALWRLLGFDRVDPPDTLRERSVWLEAGPPAARTQIHLLRTASEQAASACDRGGHVAVVAPRFEMTITALRQAGFAVDERSRHWGAARAFVAHPAGHSVEIMASPPSGGSPRSQGA